MKFSSYTWTRKSDVAMLSVTAKDDNNLYCIGELFRLSGDKWTWISLANYDWVPVSSDLDSTNLNVAKSMVINMLIHNIESCFEKEKQKTSSLLNVFKFGEV